MPLLAVGLRHGQHLRDRLRIAAGRVVGNQDLDDEIVQLAKLKPCVAHGAGVMGSCGVAARHIGPRAGTRTIHRAVGAGEWTRTTDLLITNQLLCQLSYTGAGEGAEYTEPAGAAGPAFGPHSARRPDRTLMTTSTPSTIVPGGRAGSAPTSASPGSMSVRMPVSTS